MLPGPDPIRAHDVDLRKFSGKPAVLRKLTTLHHLVLAICPECYVQERREVANPAWIYMPPDARGRNKNLLTVWTKDAGLRIIYPPRTPHESFNATKIPEYCERLYRLLEAMS